MFQTIFRSLKMTVVLAVILCGVYPLVVYLVGTTLFHDKASGGLIEKDGKVVGSRLIGQGFAKPEYFHGRPSAAGANGYDASSSSGSNLGPTSEKLKKAVEANVKQVLQDNPNLKMGEVPVDLVTTSSSGLDPHIAPESAFVQVERVAKARGLNPEKVRELVLAQTEERQLGILGEPVVNVLLLNMELDRVAPVARP